MTVTIEEIKTLLGLQLGVRNVNEEDRIGADLGAASDDMVSLLSAIEDKYHIVINNDEIVEIEKVVDLYNLVRRLVNRD